MHPKEKTARRMKAFAAPTITDRRRGSATSTTATRRCYSMKRAGASVEFYIFDEILPETAEQFAIDLADLGDVRAITLRVCSSGGDLFAGMALYNQLRQHSAPVTVKVEGVAASVASLICMAGDRIEISPAAFLMIHSPAMISYGPASQLEADARLLRKLADPVTSIYARKMRKPAPEVAELMEAETWFTGKEAVDCGLADTLTSNDAGANDALAARIEQRENNLAGYGYKNVPPAVAGGAPRAKGESANDSSLRKRIIERQARVKTDKRRASTTERTRETASRS